MLFSRHSVDVTGMKYCYALLLMTIVGPLFGGGQTNDKVTATALAYRVIPHERTTYYRTAGYSNTTCFGNGTYWSNSVSAVANCTTVSTPPEYRPISIVSIEVFNQVDIRGSLYTIRCTARWAGSNCSWLNPGDEFPAEIKGTTIWITAHKGGNLGKEARAKFQILDIRPNQGTPERILGEEIETTPMACVPEGTGQPLDNDGVVDLVKTTRLVL